MSWKITIVIVSLLTTLLIATMVQIAIGQGRQEYPRINEEEWIYVNPGERYNCPDCEMIFQGTEFTVWEHPDGNRVVVAVPITDDSANSIFANEGFIYNYCFTGIKHVIPGQCDDPEYEQYKIE